MLANENVVNATSRPLETYFDIMWGLPKLPVVSASYGSKKGLCFTIARAQMMELVGLEFVMHRDAQISGEMRIFW